MRRGWVLAWAGVALAAVGIGAVLWFMGECRMLRLEAHLAWLPALLVAGAAAVAVLAEAVRALERRRASRRLAEAEAQAGAQHRRFLARLDHELKNPLQGIRAALADAPSPRQRSSIDLQSRRIERLATDLRRLAEIEHATFELESVDVGLLLSEAVAAAQELPGAQQRRWTVSLPRAPRPLPAIKGDGDLLFLAVSNLLTNAVKYSATGDAIEVRGSETPDGVAIEIADTGMGIPADELHTVWEELSRGREARGIVGTGLGLPFVRSIVERHGGRVTLRSHHREGTAVTVFLPLSGAL